MLQAIAHPGDATSPWTAPASADARGHRGDLHGLGNLLQVASSAVGFLERDRRRSGVEVEPFVSGARDALHQAILVASRLLHGNCPLQAEEGYVEIATVLDRAVWRARTLAPSGIRIQSLPIDVAKAVVCDRQRLDDAILNLVCNGIQATQDGGTVRIGATVEEAPGRPPRVRIFVEDDGAGIDDSVMARLFTVGVSSRPGGFGLGLVGVAEFARASGGEVLLSTIRGEGTCVAIVLPTRNLRRES